uniref:Uncharacterized protein n=1 Tax=Sarcophilus harrisii TaxID=9305 RepID=A0A7N4NFY7_SARHA
NSGANKLIFGKGTRVTIRP